MFPNLITSLPGHTVLVVGDAMLDEYIWGTARRISPEAPVPIVEIERRAYNPGGAANVAINIAAMGGKVLFGGLIGEDYHASLFYKELAQHGINTEGIIADKSRPTTVKTRVIANGQQIVRVDSEQRIPLGTQMEVQMLGWIKKVIPFVEICVISDYGKGTISPVVAQHIIRLAHAQNKSVIVDPKGHDYGKYRGASLITPNLHEAEQAAKIQINSESDLVAAGRRILELLDGSALLVTRGAEGMSLFQNDGKSCVHIPTTALTVYDVTGAGDTVVSTLALAMAAGSGMEQAARLANFAAGIVVGKIGTSLVTIKELLEVCVEGTLQLALNGE